MGRAAGSLLFVSQAPPWPRDAGGSIRTAHLLAALASRYEVTLVCTEPPAERRAQARADLEELCAAVRFVPDEKSRAPLALARQAAASLARREPLVVVHNQSRGLARAVREEWAGGRHGALHLNHLDTVQYAADLSRAVIDTHNLLFEYYGRLRERAGGPLRRALLAREARLLRGYELSAFTRAARVLVCSERERRSLLALAPGLDPLVVPNGTDCEHFHPGDVDPADNPPDVVFVGDMAYGPNDDGARFFVREVLPPLRARVPEARFVVVGKNPTPELRALAKGRADVELTGFVEDVRERAWRARAGVVPIRYGSGTRLKVLEAFALGLPIVSTSAGAEGIECEDGADLLIADGPEALAAALERLLLDRELHARLRVHSRRTALERYDWRIVGRRALAAYEGLL